MILWVVSPENGAVMSPVGAGPRAAGVVQW
jgi:hypothetical protein